MARKTPPPRDLGRAGRDLWRRVRAAFELDEHEVPGLLLACRQLDDVARLEELLEAEGLVVTGSAGQPRLSAVVTELRQARLAASRLLDQLSLPVDDTNTVTTPASRRAQKAAQARWRDHTPVRDRDRGCSMARRRERAAAGPSAVGVELPDHLRDYTGPLVFAEESPEAIADTDAARRSRFAAWRAWEADRDRWAVEHGWTRRQVLGYDHPTWITRGWADPPPGLRVDSQPR